MLTTLERRLSGAELRVLNQVLKGHRNIAISKTLKLSDKTVKNHISHILRKTKCVSRMELIVRVYTARLRYAR